MNLNYTTTCFGLWRPSSGQDSGILEGGVKFKVANGTGRGQWRAEISFFQMYYVGTMANVVGKVGCNLKFTNLDLCV